MTNSLKGPRGAGHQLRSVSQSPLSSPQEGADIRAARRTPAEPLNHPLPRPRLNVGEHRGVAANPASSVLLPYSVLAPTNFFVIFFRSLL